MNALHWASWIGYLMAILTGIHVVENNPRKHSFFMALMTCLTCCCGGGFFFRDLLLLQRYPSILLQPMEVLNLVFLFILLSENKDLLFRLEKTDGLHLIFSFLDGFGLAGFVICGCQNAEEVSIPALIILSGILTGTGGGILARKFHGISPPANPRYLALAFVLSILYTSNALVDDIDFVTIVVGGFLCPLTNAEAIKRLHHKVLKANKYCLLKASTVVAYMPVVEKSFLPKG